MFERQAIHYVLLAALLAGVGWLISLDGALAAGQLAGVSTLVWLWAAIVVPIGHQVYVWFVWRSELHHGRISKWFGRERGFYWYGVGFFCFFVARLVTTFGVAIANRGTLGVHPALAYALAGFLAAPWLYLLYSVRKYFGFTRAIGIDHFDPTYRSKQFVRQGIFRYTDNAMYTFGLLGLWIIGLVFLSQAALLVALFSHVYIWVHYYCTELPDIYHIYGRQVKQ